MQTATCYTVCPHDCPDTCGVLTEVAGGRAMSVKGDPRHPVTAGWLCAKVTGYLDQVYHPDRLRYPLRRRGPKGGVPDWERISWDRAIAEIADRWQAIIAAHGAEAVLPYSFSGTLGLVQMEVCNARLWNRMGASRLLRTICGAANEQAVRATLGARRAPPYAHLLDSRVVLIWGNNPVSSAPHFAPFLRRARRAGCYVAVIDPYRSRTARNADLHLAPRPGSDAALALGLAHVIVAEGLQDEAFLTAYTHGWPALRERLAEYPPERVSTITGIEPRAIIELAHRYATTQPALIKIGDGLNRNVNGGQIARAVAALPALTGQYGVRGGGLMYSTSGVFKWDHEAIHHRAECPPRGRLVNMNRLGAALTGEITDPAIHALYVYGANPVASSPNAGLIIRGLARKDLFTVVHEQFMTDTADHADIVLPATNQLEHADLHRGYGHHLLAYNQPAIAPPGECRSNWEVMGLLATAMGFDEPWLHQDPDTVIAEILAATAATQPALADITLEGLRREGALALADNDDTPFADHRFPTPSGKIELQCDALRKWGLDPLPGWQPRDDTAAPPDGAHPDAALTLISPAGHHFVSSSFANRADLIHREHDGPRIELHPDDAATRGIEDGDEVRVENRRGECRMRAVVSDAVRPGVAATIKGWWPRRIGGRNVNHTTSDALADLAGQSTFHTNRVWVAKTT